MAKIKAAASVLLAIATIAALSDGSAARAAAPITGAADGLRTSWYPDEAPLTPGLLEAGGFGPLFEKPVQGQVYAQPLVSGDTLLVATEDNWIYGLDPLSGAIRWSRSVGPPWDPAEVGCEDLTPNVGITGTPVIDSATNVAYFFSKTYDAGQPVWDMHGVDLATGEDVAGFPVRIAGKAHNLPGIEFKPRQQLQRPALLLMNGVVYAGFGSHCDNQPYQGWVVGVSTSGLIRTMWASSAEGAAIWQSGGGLISDGEGQILFTTGNSFGPRPENTASPPEDLGESVVRVGVQPDGQLQATDFFSPFNRLTLDEGDLDLGSGAPLALPSPFFGTVDHPHLLVDVGKQGIAYLLDRENLGGLGQGPGEGNDDLQELPLSHGLWGSMAIWPGDGGYVYVPTNGALVVLSYGTDGLGGPRLSLAAESPEPLQFGSGSPIVTSNGTESGSAIVWINQCPSKPECEGSTLNAYRAVPEGGVPPLLWKGAIGVSTKFARPDAAGGRVYVGTRNGRLLAFGATEHILSVTRGEGGSVSSGVPGISCGAVCSHSFRDGSTVTLTAAPAEHFEFTGWAGAGCSGTGACDLTMYSDATVSASFARVTHSVRVAKVGSGRGLVRSAPPGITCGHTCEARFVEGDNVTLKATPRKWKVRWRGCSRATANTCRVDDLRADSRVTAIITPPPQTTINSVAVRAASRRASFGFSGSGHTRRFQCRLITRQPGRTSRPRPHFARCVSPKRYHHLGPGRYTFQVRAVNAAGPDPTPAKLSFGI